MFKLGTYDATCIAKIWENIIQRFDLGIFVFCLRTRRWFSIDYVLYGFLLHKGMRIGKTF